MEAPSFQLSMRSFSAAAKRFSLFSVSGAFMPANERAPAINVAAAQFPEGKSEKALWKIADSVRSKRYVAVLAGRVFLALVFERLQRRDKTRPRIVRHQHLIYIAQFGGLERIGESAAVIVDEAGSLGDRVLGLLYLVTKDDVDRALGTHHGDLGARVCVVEIAANVFRGHDVVGAAVGLARDHGDFRHGRLAVGEEQLRAVANDAAELLRRAR